MKRIDIQLERFTNGFQTIVKTIENSKTYMFFDIENERTSIRVLNLLDTKDVIEGSRTVKVFKDKSLIEVDISMSNLVIDIIHQGYRECEKIINQEKEKKKK